MRDFKLITAALIAITAMSNACMCETVDPGNRGVLVTQGKVDDRPYPEALQQLRTF